MHSSGTALSSISEAHQDLATAVIDGILAGRQVIAVVNGPGFDCTPVIGAIADALEASLTRIVIVRESSVCHRGPAMSAMDQISESVEQGAEKPNESDAPADRVSVVNRGLKMLTRHPSGEKRRLLVVELAHIFVPETLEQLARLTGIGPPELRLQLLLVGDPIFWHKLQAAKFEEMRQRVGVPYLALASLRSGVPFAASAPSHTRSADRGRIQRTFRRKLVLAAVVVLGAALSIAGLDKADADLPVRLMGHLSKLTPLWPNESRASSGASQVFEPGLPSLVPLAMAAVAQALPPEAHSIVPAGPPRVEEAGGDAGVSSRPAPVDAAGSAHDLPASHWQAGSEATRPQEIITGLTSTRPRAGESNPAPNVEPLGAESPIPSPDSRLSTSAQTPAIASPMPGRLYTITDTGGFSGTPLTRDLQELTLGQLALVSAARELFGKPPPAEGIQRGSTDQTGAAALPEASSRVPASSAPPLTPPSSSQASPEALTERGDQMVARSDVPGARLLYAPAAALGSSRAAVSMRAPVHAEIAPAPEPRATAASPPAAVAALLARGDALIAIGHIAAARLVYQRAAAHGSGLAATATGKTYDPRFLRQIGAIGVVADSDAAATWYRKGAALGDGNAAPFLDGLEPKTGQ